MKRCHQGCGAICFACDFAQRSAANGVAEKDLGNAWMVGHVSAMASLMRGRGPISGLHLCDDHAKFVTAAAELHGIRLIIGHPINTAAAPGLN